MAKPGSARSRAPTDIVPFMSRRVGLLGLLSFSVGIAGWGCSKAPTRTRNAGPGAETFVEGSRLKARWVALPGARRMFNGWFDSQLGEGCTFETIGYLGSAMPDASVPRYCRPRHTSDSGDVYADADCTQVVVNVTCDDVHFVELPPDSSDCASSGRLYRVGPAVTNGMMYASLDGVCTLLKANDPMAPQFPHRLGDWLTTDQLVSAAVAIGSGSGRIVVTQLVASDGSRQALGAWDSQRAENVFARDWYRDTLDGKLGKWEPTRIAQRVATAHVFSDAACTKVAATYTACGDVTFRSVFEPQPGACYEATTYYEAGPKLDLGSAFANDGSGKACRAAVAGDLSFMEHAVTVGAPIPADSFASVQTWEEQSQTAVRIRRPGTADGPVGGPDESMFDDNHGTACQATIAADGVLRCLPGEYAGNAYADPGCTVPVLAITPAAPPCYTYLPPLVGVIETVSTSACGDVLKAHERPVGADHVGAVYTTYPLGTCAPIAPQDLAALGVFDLGQEIPPSSFAALETSTP